MAKKLIAAGALVMALLALVLAGIIPGQKALAATGDTTGDIGFYVQAVLPDNQIDETLTYFDLSVNAGQTQTLEVEVVNETAQPITVDIGAISASTNRNGVIDYKTPNIRDKTLEHPFSELAAVEVSALAVPALGTATARVTVNMPAETYDGVVLGGLVFTRRPAARQPDADGMTLQNRYSYVIGVKLSETDTVVDPDFELESIQGETVNYQPALVHSVRNKTAAIAKGVELHVLIRDESGQAVGEARHTGIDMAPNSVMPLAVTPTAPVEQSGGTTPALLPGNYTSEVTLEHGGQSWAFEQKFTIGSVQAEQINNETVGGTPREKTQTTTLFIILLAVAAAIILGLFIILMRMLRRREETKELNRLMRKRREELRLREKYKSTL